METQKKYVEKLTQMIRAQTVSAYAETDLTRFYDFQKLLRRLFPSVFRVCDFEDFDGSILLRWRGVCADKPIMFMNHFDVVEAGGDWKHAPFSGDVEDGKIYGRGTVDTKGGLFCMLQAAEELMESGFRPAHDIYFVSACTEECDGTGADKISREMERRGIRFAYSLDEGGMILRDPLGTSTDTFAMVAVGEKGCAEIRFTARSAGGHASKPGKNTPLVRLAKFMCAVERSRVFVPKISPAVREMLLRTSRGAGGAMRFILGHAKAFSPLLCRILPAFSPAAASMLKTTLAFTMAQGSEAANVLPQEAWVMGNMRFSPHQGGEGSLAAVRKIARRYGVEMTVTDPGFSSPTSDFETPAFRLIERAVGELFPGVKTSPYLATTASDNRYMSRVTDQRFGLVPFRLSDEQLDSIHGINENLDISCLEPAVAFYRYLMKETDFYD